MREERRKVEEEDAKRRAKKAGHPYLNLISVKVPTELKALQLIPEADARKARVAPVQVVGKKLILAAFDPALPEVGEVVKKLEAEGYTVQLVTASLFGLEHMWRLYEYVHEADAGAISGSMHVDMDHVHALRKEVRTLEDFSRVLQSSLRESTSRLLEVILASGIALRASDIHVEPAKETAQIRVRIDGMLHGIEVPLPRDVYRSLVMRLKLLSHLKLNITGEAQDGRFTINLAKQDIEIRTSLIPSEHGETVVLRVLDPRAIMTKLDGLGLREDDLVIIREVLSRPHGLVLNTGPTGSGKTTTLYAFLRSVSRPDNKVVTIEDPIEYHLDGISQTQVDPDANYTFLSGLRSILRQDPDVILIGEIRDEETADVALNASLTGHMVFSTLHTNDAVGAVPRLYDLKVQPQVLGPALTLVIAQRLVRILCPTCREEVPVTDVLSRALAGFFKQLPERVDRTTYDTPTMYKPKGCDACGGVGYKGRVGLFELFFVDETLEKLIYVQPTQIELYEHARAQGMVSMQEDGVMKVLGGVTSFEEVARLTGTIAWLPDAGAGKAHITKRT